MGRRSLMGGGVVLDTHAWIWWTALEQRLGEGAKRAIAEADSIGISAISVWEVVMLERKGRISFDRRPAEWVRQALARPGVEAIAVDPPIAVSAAALDGDGAPADPTDRMIYATARSLGATLVTKDEVLREFDPRGTVW